MAGPRVQGLPSVVRDEEIRKQVEALQARLLAKSASMQSLGDGVTFISSSSPPTGEIVEPAPVARALPPVAQSTPAPTRVPQFMGALESRVFPYVGQEDYDHPYYEEAMQYQERIARQGVNDEHSLKRAKQQEAALKMLQNKVSLLRLIETD